MKKFTRNQKIVITAYVIVPIIIFILTSVFKKEDIKQETVYSAYSNNQSGGITTGVLNIGKMSPPTRQLSDELKKSLRETRKFTHPKCVYVENRFSKESLEFASEINNFLKSKEIESKFYPGTMFMLNTNTKPSNEGVIIQDESHISPSDDCIYIFILAQLE